MITRWIIKFFPCFDIKVPNLKFIFIVYVLWLHLHKHCENTFVGSQVPETNISNIVAAATRREYL